MVLRDWQCVFGDEMVKKLLGDLLVDSTPSADLFGQISRVSHQLFADHSLSLEKHYNRGGGAGGVVSNIQRSRPLGNRPQL